MNTIEFFYKRLNLDNKFKIILALSDNKTLLNFNKKVGE